MSKEVIKLCVLKDRREISEWGFSWEVSNASSVDFQSINVTALVGSFWPSSKYWCSSSREQGSHLALFGRHFTVFGALSESPAPNY